MHSGPAAVGSPMLHFILVLHGGLLALIGPLSTAGRISQEREQRTLASLLNSPASPLSLVIGKLAASWIFIIWISMFAMPFLAIGSLWGGMPVDTVIAIFLSNTFCAMTLAALGLGMSAFCGRTMSSYLLTGITFFAWAAVLPLICMMLQITSSSRKISDSLAYTFLYHNPFYPFFYYFSQIDADRATEELGLSTILFCYAVWIGVMAISIRSAVSGLKRETI